MKKVNWKIKNYEKEDEENIIPIFNSIFNVDRSMNHWLWKFESNPYLKPTASLAIIGDKNIIGQYTSIPLALNSKGERRKICQSVDTFVNPDFRMQGVIKEITEHYFQQCEGNGFEMVFGFPNKELYPMQIRRLNWKHIFTLERFLKRLSIYSPIKRKLKLRILASILNITYKIILQAILYVRILSLSKKFEGKITFNVENKTPKEYNQLWQIAKDKEVLSVWKDAEYFKWRYDSNPDNKFKYFYITKDRNEIEVLFVVNLCDNKAKICDIIMKNRNIYIAHFLLYHLEKWLMDNNFEYLEFAGKNNNLYSMIFNDFKNIKNKKLIFCIRTFKNSTLKELPFSPNNWNITMGDIDNI